MQVGRERRSPVALVVEGEHADAPGLAVAAERKRDGSARAAASRRTPRIGVELQRRPVAEERKRDMEVLARDHPDLGHAGEGLVLPRGEAPGRLVGEAQRAEEA